MTHKGWCIVKNQTNKQDIRALSGAVRDTEPAGEIRVCIHKQLSHSDVDSKMTYKSKTCGNRYNRISEWI